MDCDILAEAVEAIKRDCPGFYDDYLVGNLIALSTSDKQQQRGGNPNAPSLVSALGFGDVPTATFTVALNYALQVSWSFSV